LPTKKREIPGLALALRFVAFGTLSHAGVLAGIPL
jgi:hypothetical protein